MIACILHGVENDTLKGEKYIGTASDLMAAVQTTIDGTHRLLAGYMSDDNIVFLDAYSVSVVVVKGLRKYHKDLSQT